LPRGAILSNAEVSIGGTFWTKSELFLTKIRIATFNCRPAGGNPAQRFRSPDGEQNRKIFLTFFSRPLAKIFSIKETKIFLFCLPACPVAALFCFGADARTGRFPPPAALCAAMARGQGVSSP